MKQISITTWIITGLILWVFMMSSMFVWWGGAGIVVGLVLAPGVVLFPFLYWFMEGIFPTLYFIIWAIGVAGFVLYVLAKDKNEYKKPWNREAVRAAKWGVLGVIGLLLVLPAIFLLEILSVTNWFDDIAFFVTGGRWAYASYDVIFLAPFILATLFFARSAYLGVATFRAIDKKIQRDRMLSLVFATGSSFMAIALVAYILVYGYNVIADEIAHQPLKTRDIPPQVKVEKRSME